MSQDSSLGPLGRGGENAGVPWAKEIALQIEVLRRVRLEVWKPNSAGSSRAINSFAVSVISAATKLRILRGGCVLKITRAVNGEVVIKLSGRMGAENIGELEALVHEEAAGRRIVLDLSDLTFVDQDAVSFLKRCEADNITLKNCPAYIREWIMKSRGGS